MPERRQPINLEVNGRTYQRSVEPRLLLSDFLRHELRLTGTHVGCEHGVCGACTVLVDQQPTRSCLMLAIQADGASITTVEGLADVAHLALRQGALGAAVRQARVRYDERRRLVEVAQVGGGIDRPHARMRQRHARIDASDPRMAVRTAQDRRVQHARWIDVVHEAAQAAQQAWVFVPTDWRHPSVRRPGGPP